MEFSDHQVSRDIISFLATQGWEKIVEDGILLEFVDRLVAKFMLSLEDAKLTSFLQYAIHCVSWQHSIMVCVVETV